MKTDLVIVLVGCVVMIAHAVFIRVSWDKWRKKGIIEAGKLLGFRHLMPGEILPVVLVPLIDRADRKYFLILRGELNGYEAAFFDLLVQAGKDWFYQSTVTVKNPQINMPMFQLKPRDWSHVITQKTCGDPLNVPDREKDMGSLKLSSNDPQWAVQTFAKATPQFFQKLQKGKWTIEGYQHSLYIYSWGRTMYPRKLQEYVRQAAEISAEMYSLCS